MSFEPLPFPFYSAFDANQEADCTCHCCRGDRGNQVVVDEADVGVVKLDRVERRRHHTEYSRRVVEEHSAGVQGVPLVVGPADAGLGVPPLRLRSQVPPAQRETRRGICWNTKRRKAQFDYVGTQNGGRPSFTMLENKMVEGPGSLCWNTKWQKAQFDYAGTQNGGRPHTLKSSDASFISWSTWS